MPRSRRLLQCLVHLIALSLIAPAFPQSVAFEVASVKPSPPAPPNPFGFPVRSTVRVDPGGQFSATQVTLRELIRRAYDLPDFLVVGGPAWTASERFDVTAKAEARGAVSEDEMRGMLRSLLADRFHLKVHTETRQLPVFRLVAARRDGKPGAQLRPSAVDCPAVRASRGPGAPSADRSSACGIDYRMEGGIMTMEIRGEPLSELMRALVTETRRPVLDETGLRGTFDGSLSFIPEPLPGLPPPPGRSPDGVSAFTALQEQLGLELESARGAVDVLVIESADQATEN